MNCSPGLSSNCQALPPCRLQKSTNSFSNSRPVAEMPRCAGLMTNARSGQMHVSIFVSVVTIKVPSPLYIDAARRASNFRHSVTLSALSGYGKYVNYKTARGNAPF